MIHPFFFIFSSWELVFCCRSVALLFFFMLFPILLISFLRRQYAEFVQRALEKHGWPAHIRFFDRSLPSSLDRAYEDGITYIIIIGIENEKKKNVSFRIINQRETLRMYCCALCSSSCSQSLILFHSICFRSFSAQTNASFCVRCLSKKQWRKWTQMRSKLMDSLAIADSMKNGQ